MLVFVLPIIPLLGLLGAGFLAKGSSVTIAGVFMERRLNDAVHAARTGAFYDSALLDSEASGGYVRGQVPSAEDGPPVELLLTEAEWREAGGAAPDLPEAIRTTPERFGEIIDRGMMRAGLAEN